ncbi:glycosyltransferase family 4 protein [Caballeronia concitans]|uniref:Glycosyl transferase family 1 n=1 Tax=Caballeronia concitans TaxID=1777133 RepID=A0A658QTP1_9BURK|nr:glycosyltransferase family 4 protein [Caballeronia concitans]KIG01923.1 glycosyl transferase group 1 [Burkholderia sp. MR1]SAL20632.1 glycosyl transferase family 1 [Caballeronia concitans]
MKALKVLHSESSTGWGGQEIRTLKEMLALRERGHIVEVVCPRDAGIGIRSAELGFKVHYARLRGVGDIRSLMSVQALLRRHAFDVLNTHSGHDSLVAGTAARFVGTPLVVRTRHLALPISSLATYNWIPHRVIAVSQYVRRYLISVGVSADRVETIYDGIVKPEPIAQSTLRAELGLGSDAVICCMVAIMRDKKGHEDLISAAQPLLARRSNLHIVMAGNGERFDEIKGVVDGLGLGRRIHLIGFRTDIPNVLRGCDLFVLPTHQEALGQSYIEAMAAGLPVIGTDVDGVPELIKHNVNGLLVPPKNPDALRAALVQLIDNPDQRTRFGEAGRRMTKDRFSVDDMADETIDFYLRGLHRQERHA